MTGLNGDGQPRCMLVRVDDQYLVYRNWERAGRLDASSTANERAALGWAASVLDGHGLKVTGWKPRKNGQSWTADFGGDPNDSEPYDDRHIHFYGLHVQDEPEHGICVESCPFDTPEQAAERERGIAETEQLRDAEADEMGES